MLRCLRPVLIGWLCLCAGMGLAQEIGPFDLIDRLPEEVQREVEIRRNHGFDSPFDVPPPGQTPRPVNPFLEEVPENAPVDEIYEKEKVMRFALVVSLTLGVVLAILFLFFRETIAQCWRGLVNNNLLTFFQRSQGRIADLSYQLLYGYSAFSIAFFVLLLSYRRGDLSLDYLSTFTWAGIGFGIVGLYFLKHLLLKILAVVFPIEATLRSYGFLLIVFTIMLGLVLFPFSLGLAFGKIGLHKFLIISSLSLTALWLIFLILRSLLIGQQYILGNSFHFLLYLCAAEIAPLFILFRFFFD